MDPLSREQFYHIFIQVQKNEWEPYIYPRVITPPLPVWGPIPVWWWPYTHGNFACSYSTCVLHLRWHLLCILSIILFSNNGASILLSCPLRYIIILFERIRKNKKIKNPSFDASLLLYDHSLTNEHKTHTPLHDPYHPNHNEPLDKNRLQGASSYHSWPCFVLRSFWWGGH